MIDKNHINRLEESIIGSVLINPEVFLRVDRIIAGRKMTGIKTSIVWQAIHEVFQECNKDVKEITDLAVIGKISCHADRVKEIGNPQIYLLETQEEITVPAYAIKTAKELVQLYSELDVSNILSRAQQSAHTGKWRDKYPDFSSFSNAVVEQILKSYSNTENSNDLRSVSKIVAESFTPHIENLLTRKGELAGISSGYKSFDNITSGFRGGQMIIVAGRPGTGKTTFAMNIANVVSMRSDKYVALFSLEMTRDEVLERSLCSELRYNSSQLKRGYVSQSKKNIFLNVMKQISKANMSITDKCNMTIWDLMTSARKYKLELESSGKELGLIVVDYIQLLSEPDSKRRGRNEEVSEISRRIKTLAKDLNVPIVVLAQMNRSVEQRKTGSNARPQLSDLKESGALEQDADIVLFLHNHNKFEDEESDITTKRRLMELIIAKHRQGPTGSIKLSYRPEIYRFDEWHNGANLDDSDISF